MRIKAIIILLILLTSCTKIKYVYKVKTITIKPPAIAKVECPELSAISLMLWNNINQKYYRMQLIEIMMLNTQSLITCIELYKAKEKKQDSYSE